MRSYVRLFICSLAAGTLIQSAGCGDTTSTDDLATSVDLRAPSDFTVTGDMSGMQPDMTKPDLSMADMTMAAMDDLSMQDLSQLPDLTQAPDITRVLDLPAAPDQGTDGGLADLRSTDSAMPDLISLDLATPDLVSGDLATGPDLRSIDMVTLPDMAMVPSLLLVVQVGDGVAALSTSAAQVKVRKFKSDGVEQVVDKFPLTLPIVANGGQQAFTVAGSAVGEGMISQSSDGRYATLAGYAAAPGTANISATASANTNRVIARLDRMGTSDTSTRFTSAYDKDSIRAATSDDGTRFWAAGTSADPALGGSQLIKFGIQDPGTQVSATINDTRVVHVITGQLYGSSGVANYNTALTVGLGLPMFMFQMTRPVGNGLVQANTSPYSFALFDTDGQGGVDLLYLADDRATNGGGGVQRWTFDGLAWTLKATITGGLATGVRGLAAVLTNNVVTIYATTTEASANKLVSIVDQGMAPMATTLATAPANTAFRGVCLAPLN